jgi:class 3 adenylate cyclase/HAMP domain-containing protein
MSMSLRSDAVPAAANRLREHLALSPRIEARVLPQLVALVFLVNLGGVGLVRVYTLLNLRPFIPGQDAGVFHQPPWYTLPSMWILLSTVASVVYLWPIFRSLRLVARVPAVTLVPSAPVLRRALNIPITLGLFCLLGWLAMTIAVALNVPRLFSEPTLGTWAHFVVRPILAGLITGVSVYFGAEYLCRSRLWPGLLASVEEMAPWGTRIRLAHRHLLLWLAISFLPLSVTALIALARTEVVGARGDPLLVQVMTAIAFVGASAALGGAGLAWLMARSIGRPLRQLEHAMADLRGGRFDTRITVTATDEIGTVAAGFNQMAHRLEESYRALEARNRELAEAVDRVTFLEGVKRGLDRFVPDTVRRLIEANPEAPLLAKESQDLTVLFLDIEGYTHLTETLPPRQVTELVERYFSLYLPDIRDGGGDINETAGDGLMILFMGSDRDDHATAAIRAARAIREKTVAANRQPDRPHPAITVNIGINSGTAEVGSTRLSSIAGDRLTYTATGTVTNVAARLCAEAQQGQILVGPETARRVHGKVPLRRLGPRQLKNVEAPVDVWEVDDATAMATPA